MQCKLILLLFTFYHFTFLRVSNILYVVYKSKNDCAQLENENALQKASTLFFWIKVDFYFQNFCSTDEHINQSRQLCGNSLPSVSHNNDINADGWQAQVLLDKLLNCPANILKYFYMYRLSYSCSFCMRRWSPNPPLIFLQKHDEDIIFITRCPSFSSSECPVKTVL